MPKECWFAFEFRHLPEDDSDSLASRSAHVREENLLPEMQRVSPDSGFSWEQLSRIPGLSTDEDADVIQLAKSLTGANNKGRVSFATEGGLFQQANTPAVVCGPGSIEQAHKPNEFIALDQIAQCEAFIHRLMERCWEMY